MPKIVILGSCKYGPYEILAVPNKIPGAWNTEKGYQIAAKKFYPAIKEADMILVYAPDGIGEHTGRDIAEARRQGKEIYIIVHESALNEKNALLEEFREAVIAQKQKITKLENQLTFVQKQSVPAKHSEKEEK